MWPTVARIKNESRFSSLEFKFHCSFLPISALLVTETEKAMAPHSSTLAWKIPWTEEPGGLHSMGSRRVGHDWATSLWLFTFMHWRRKWQPLRCSCLENPRTAEPGGLPSMGPHRVGHDWSDLAAVTENLLLDQAACSSFGCFIPISLSHTYAAI